MEIQGNEANSQKLTDEDFTFGATEITPSKDPVQDDVTLTESKESVDVPLVSSEDAPKKPETKPETPKDKPKVADTPPVEDTPNLVETLRENNLEVFTKELFTNDVTDKEFANQLLKDKYFGRESYTKELDLEKVYANYPKEVSTEIKGMETDLARSIANLSPNDKKVLGQSKGSDEEYYNPYLYFANENIEKLAAISGGIGGAFALTGTAVGAVPVAGAFAVATLAAFGTMYAGLGTLNAITRAEKDSPEDIKAMNTTKLDKQGLLDLADEYLPYIGANKVKEMLVREDDDSSTEAYVKELTRVLIDEFAIGGGIAAINKGIKGAKGLTKVLRGTDKASDNSPELSETMEKLNDYIRVKKVVKEQNKILQSDMSSYDQIISKYESATPPLPSGAANNAIDYDKLAGETYDKLVASKFKDNEAYEAFKYYTAKGSNHKLGTTRTVDLAKDASEAELAKISNPEKFGKGSRGTGTEAMDIGNKIDEIGEQRIAAQNAGDFELDSKLSSLQETLISRANIKATQQGGGLQELNRSMPLRKSMTKQYNERTRIALELKQSGLNAKYRAKLEKDLAKTEKYLTKLASDIKGSTNEELLTMGAANTLYSNMLGGAAISKAAIGGLVSTVNNSAQLALRGVKPAQVFKMQMNAAKQLKDDIRKLDLSELKSDIVHGSINSRFKSKNVAKVTPSSTDTATKKALKKANKAVNVVASPIQGGLGIVDNLIDTFNSRTRVTEAWLDYSRRQKAMGRTSEDLVEELNKIVDNPENMSATFNREVLQAAEESLATDKMMLKKPHSQGYLASKVAWSIDEAFNTHSQNLLLNTTLKFVNPFTRTGASMLDSIAENSAIGMFRRSADNGLIGAITPRQIIGTAASIGLFYGLQEDVTSVAQTAEKKAGAFGLRTGITIGGHNFPLAVLGVYGEVIEKFMVMQHAMEAAALDGVDTSNISPILGGLLEVTTAYGMAENIKQTAQFIVNIPENKSKSDVSKMIENFMPAGYIMKGAADLDSGAMAANPYLAQVFGEFNTEFGNAKRRDAFGTPLSEGENLELDRSFTWLIDRKGEDKAGLEVKKMLLDSGVWSSQRLASFKTDEGLIPYNSIKVNGTYGTFSATMTPLGHSITVGSKGKNSAGERVKVTSATRNKALGVMSLHKDTMVNILKEEITNLNYIDISTPEAKRVRDEAKENLIKLGNGLTSMLRELSKYGMNKPLPKALKMLMENDAPNITSKFDQKRYEIRNLMRYNKNMFNGDLKKQKEFFTRVNRVKDTVLFYNSIKDLGLKFMQNSAEAVSAEIKRIEYIKSK